MEPENVTVEFPPLERKRRKSRSPAAYALLVVFFLLCAYFGFWLARMLWDPLIPRDKDVVPGASNEVLNILLLGVDQRENEPARSDTIILASLNLKTKEVSLLSIPRDTRVDIPGKGITRKINYAMAAGGTDLAASTVESFLGVPVHYYVETNFQGFARCIDIMGGITLNVEQRMYYPEENIDLKAGLQKLKGSDALSYVRWRGDGRGDIGRIERQQKFFNALMNQAVSFSTVWKLPQLLDELNSQVKTDLSLQKMLILANKFKDTKNIKLTTYMVPGVPDDINYGGSYWIADKKALSEILAKINGVEIKTTP